MLFNSFEFLVFFPAVVLCYFLIPEKFRYLWLLVCSYYFYMCWNAGYVLLLLFSTLVTYGSGLCLAHIKQSGKADNVKMKQQKLCVAASFCLNLAVLFFFKYYGFTADNINGLLQSLHMGGKMPEFDILLPVGISFYTFQALSYTMDVYRGEIYAEKNLFKYALFVSFFPQLVAGPIERSKNLLVQMNEKHTLCYDNVRNGLLMMLWGYFLKLVLADRIAVVVDTVYSDTVTYQGFYVIFATVLFAFQIYCDFNGYSTIARGAALIMGFRLMENFDAPYLSTSVSEFWRRWHISLSGWFRDYLYIPLGGNRKGKRRKVANIMVVFLTSGLWHGAAWTYVIWGGLNGIYQVIGEWLRPLREMIVNKTGIGKRKGIHRLLKVLVTFCLVDFAWIFFRAESMESVLEILRGFRFFNPSVLWNGSLYLLGIPKFEMWFLFLMLCILFAADFLKFKKISVWGKLQQRNVCLRAVAAALLLFCVVMFGIYGTEYEAAQFIYFQF